MITQLINELREQNGRRRVFYWDGIVSDHCNSHSLAMANKNELYHAEPYLRNGWSEAVAMCSFRNTSWESFRYLIFDILASDEPHRNVLLNFEVLAYGVVILNNQVYLTIRGK